MIRHNRIIALILILSLVVSIAITLMGYEFRYHDYLRYKNVMLYCQSIRLVTNRYSLAPVTHYRFIWCERVTPEKLRWYGNRGRP